MCSLNGIKKYITKLRTRIQSIPKSWASLRSPYCAHGYDPLVLPVNLLVGGSTYTVYFSAPQDPAEAQQSGKFFTESLNRSKKRPASGVQNPTARGWQNFFKNTQKPLPSPTKRISFFESLVIPAPIWPASLKTLPASGTVHLTTIGGSALGRMLVLSRS